MESIQETKLKNDSVEMNYLSEVKRKRTFNYFKNKKIILKKRGNSMFITSHQKNKLVSKYNFNDKSINIGISKTYKKLKTPLIKTGNEFKKRSNLMRESSKNMNMKKIVTFGQSVKNFNDDNNVNKINIIQNRLKNFNSLDCDQLPIDLNSKNHYKKEDFQVLALSGKGAYGTVLQVKLKREDLNKTKKKYYAIKVMDIKSMQRVNKLYQVYLESQILHELNSPFIVQIYGTFYTKNKIYMVLDYLSKGDFATFIKMNYPLKEETIKFYAAEIVSFLEYLQSQKIVHRDLKPENIMLNDSYHLQMIDFATARKIGYYYDKNEMKFREDNYDFENDYDDIKGTKIIVNPDKDDDDEDDEIKELEKKEENKNKIKKLPVRNKTFVGTAEYVSPEVIDDQPAGYGADLWAFGIMLYQMFCGITPFKGRNTFLTFKNIEKLEISFPNDISISESAKDLIRKILVKEPSERLGAGEEKTDFDLEHLKNHSFFQGIKWENLISQNVPYSKTFKFKSNKKIVRKNEENVKNDDKIHNNDNKDVIILRKGCLYKKSFWFHYNERFFILDSSPRITYKDPDKDTIRGTIYLNKKCRVYASRQDIFNLETPKRDYKFKCKKNDMALWVSAIKDCIKNYGKDE